MVPKTLRNIFSMQLPLFTNIHFLLITAEFYNNHQAQMSSDILSMKHGIMLRLIHPKEIFSNDMLSNYKKVFKNYRK